MLSLGVRTHLITAHYALPFLIERAGGLLVEVTDGTAEYNCENVNHREKLKRRTVALSRPPVIHRLLPSL